MQRLQCGLSYVLLLRYLRRARSRWQAWQSHPCVGFVHFARVRARCRCHNFRDTNRKRVRHRFYHKLNGFTGSHDYQLCVGCGRCVYACKANINPIEVLKFFDRKGAEADGE